MSTEISKKVDCDVLVNEDSKNDIILESDLRIEVAAKDDIAVDEQNTVLGVGEDLKILEITDDVVCANICLNKCRCKPSICGNQEAFEVNHVDDELHSNITAVYVPEMPTNRAVRTVRRTLSESCSNVCLKKGILKYPRGWRRRTLSESNCDTAFSCDEFECENFSATESIPELMAYDGDSQDEKPKKNVRFNERISKTMFRTNSSILGRKQKNQKRAKRRKGQPKNNSSQNSSIEDMFSETKNEASVTSVHLSENPDGETELRFRQDSGYDSEECSKCDTEGKWCEVISKKNLRRRNRKCTE